MNALLILNNDDVQNLRIMVTLSKKTLKAQVISLLENDRDKEALELLKSRGEVSEYLPIGCKPSVKPEVTLIEDML